MISPGIERLSPRGCAQLAMHGLMVGRCPDCVEGDLVRFVLSTCAPGIELVRDEPETAQILKFRKPIDDPLTSAIATNLANQIFPIVRDLAGPGSAFDPSGHYAATRQPKRSRGERTAIPQTPCPLAAYRQLSLSPSPLIRAQPVSLLAAAVGHGCRARSGPRLIGVVHTVVGHSAPPALA